MTNLDGQMMINLDGQSLMVNTFISGEEGRKGAGGSSRAAQLRSREAAGATVGGRGRSVDDAVCAADEAVDVRAMGGAEGRGSAQKRARSNDAQDDGVDRRAEEDAVGGCTSASLSAACLQTHARDNSHVCHTCGKAFWWYDSLTVHMRTHTKEKKYVCETCGSAFARIGQMTVHKLTHTGEKPHVCETCGKAFSTYTNLSAHMRTHSGKKPHVCETCGMEFSRFYNMARHMQTHMP